MAFVTIAASALEGTYPPQKAWTTPMITRFDHVIIAARNLDAATQLYTESFGLDARFGGRHTGRGTHNAIVRFGLDYLEILSVVDEAELRAAPAKRVRLLDFLARQEGGLLAYCLATDDIDGLAAQFKAAGLEALGPFDMERTRPDGLTLKWRLLIPGGSAYRQPWPFFIQWGMDDAERLTHEVPGEHPLGASGVTGAVIAVADLDAARHLYGSQLGLKLSAGDTVAGDTVAALGAARLRYRLGAFNIDLLAPDGAGPIRDELDKNGEGVYAITLAVKSLEVAKKWLEGQGIRLANVAGYDGLVAPEPESGMRSRLWLRQGE